MAESMKGLHRTCRCAEVTKDMVGSKVTLMGWVQKARNKGGLVFVDLRDRSGIMQVIFENGSIDQEGFEKAGKLRSEFVIAVTGTVENRGGAVNENLATGALELRAESLRILAESEVPPFPIEENSKTKDEIRLKYRYLDLRRPDLQRNLMMKSKVMMLTRKFFTDEGFLEVETPMLGKSTPEGARDYLVPSRIHPGSFYGLPQSPQLYKQLLMCSGYDRYIQIARCFRDEDLRADRQPEFTQIDMELSFVDVDDVIEVNERFLAKLFKEVLDVDVQLPIQRMTWQEAMDRFGSDKPDLRFGMELTDVTDVVKNCGFSVFTGAVENGGSVRGINAKGQGGMPRKKIDKLTAFVKDYGAKGLAYIAIQEDGSIKSSFAKFMTEEEMDALIKAMGAEAGDLLLFAADKNKVVWDSLGALRVELAKQLELLDKNEFRFVWITEFPLLEWSEEQNRYVAMHHPFTMPMEEDLPLIDSDPGKVRAKAYDIVLNGNEIGGGSVRIFQDDIQEKMFEVLGFTKEQVLEYAAQAESYSNHPIAKSIQEAFGKTIDQSVLSGYEEISGHGIRVLIGGKRVLAGNSKLMDSEKVSYAACQSAGTKVYIAVDGRYAGCIVIADEVKDDSQNAIASLKKIGVEKTVMLTGDDEKIGKAVAEQLGLDEYYAQLLPDQKVEKLEYLDQHKTKGSKLAFVGDGINDAPVLARADVGIAMGGLGSDAAIEAADVVLMTDEPSKLVDAIDVAKATKRIVMQNIIIALGIKSVFLILGALGIAGMWEAVFGDVGVTIIAVLNAMRILKK